MIRFWWFKDTNQSPNEGRRKNALTASKNLLIYSAVSRQNEIIFEAEKERNVWELERNDLKGIARFTKKGELQSKIDCKNEEIDILKIGLSGIAKKYGYQNNQKQNKESVLERLKKPPKRTADYQQQKTIKGKDRGARQSFGLY